MNVWNITVKDIRILLKERGNLFGLFLLPLVFILAFSLPSLAGGGEAERFSLPVVNLAPGDATAELLIARLEEAGGVEVQSYEQDKAQALLQEGEIHYLLTIPADIAEMSVDHAVSLKLETHPDADGTEAQWVEEVATGVARDLALEAHLLASLQQMGRMSAASPSHADAFSSENLVAQAQSQFEASLDRPLVTVEQRLPTSLGEREETVGTKVSIAGFTVLFVFLTAQTTARSIYEEKRDGSFRRLLAAPMSKATLLAGKMLPNLITALLQIAVIFAIGVLVYPLLGLERLALGNNWLGLILVSLLLALCSTGMGILIAALARTEGQIGGVSSVILWVGGALGGAFFPLYLIKGPLDMISRVTPHSWALRAYYDVLVRGKGVAAVGTELLVLLGFTLAFFAFGLWRFSFD
jgi:ABC-2 type transport system permease protein